MSHLARHSPRHADIVKYHDRTCHCPATIVNGGGGILDSGLDAVASNQHAVWRQRYNFVVSYRLRSGVLHDLARRAIDDLQDVLKRMTCRFVLRPTCQVFSDSIEIGDPTGNVGAHDCVPDRVECDLGALPFLKQRLGICSPLDHGREGLGQQVSVETVLKEVVLCSTLYRQPGGLLVLRVNQQQDRNVGRRAKETVEHVYAVSVGQVEVEQYRLDAVQAFQAFSAVLNPFNLEGLTLAVTQCVDDGFGSGCIALDQKYALRHGCS